MNPAKNNMIIGSANDAIMSLDFNSSPIPSPLNTLNEFSDTVMHIMVIIDNDVAHAGIHSVSHDSVAKTKIAIMRCCTTVRTINIEHRDGKIPNNGCYCHNS